MSRTALEIFNEGMKRKCATWLKAAKQFKDNDYELDAKYYIFKDGYKVVLKQSQHKDTLADLVEFKFGIDKALEGLDDDKSYYKSGEKLKEGTKLIAYDFLKEMNDEYNDLVITGTMVALIQKCDNKSSKIRKHFHAYREQVKSKLDKMVQGKKEAHEVALRLVAKWDGTLKSGEKE